MRMMSDYYNQNNQKRPQVKQEPAQEESPYRCGDSYPPVQCEEKNPLYARTMLDNVGGSNSEMSAISLYLYDGIIQSDCPELAEAFRQISMVEMRHLHIFSTLAWQLGEDPRLWSQRNRSKMYWTPGYNKYPRKLHELLEYALEGERAAVRKYQNQCERIRDQNIVENLKRIIRDEEKHVALFEAFCAKY